MTSCDDLSSKPNFIGVWPTAHEGKCLCRMAGQREKRAVFYAKKAR